MSKTKSAYFIILKRFKILFYFYIRTFIGEENISLIKKACFMLIFLNLKSKAIHLFFSSSIQPQHTVYLYHCSAQHAQPPQTSPNNRFCFIKKAPAGLYLKDLEENESIYGQFFDINSIGQQ